MNQTLTEKLICRKSRGPVVPGSAYHRVPVDLVLGHDATISLLIDRFKRTARHVWDPSRCVFAADHFAPPSTPERADILRRYLDFVRAESIPDDLLYRGISHQLLAEDPRSGPGIIVCGADSHTIMAGALGCFATGLGSTDILALLMTGEVFLSVPQSIRVNLRGELPDWLFGKDLALELLSRIGEGGAVGKALEFHDMTENGVDMSGRLTMTNMSVEAGATNGVFVPDRILSDFLASRNGSGPGTIGTSNDCVEHVTLAPDEGAHYEGEIELAVDRIPPLAALPGSPADVVALRDIEHTTVDQVFIGSCAGGRTEDIGAAAKLLRARRVAPGVRLVVTPASQRIYNECLKDGSFEHLSQAGAMITNSSCGGCGGIDKGLIGAGEVCVSTANRNFRGRMGSPDGRIYLTSPLSAAAAALTGRLVDPRELLD